MEVNGTKRQLLKNGFWTVRYLRYNQVPNIYREPFILTRYRSSRSSIGSCVASASCWTNETLNFWTHFVPFLFFSFTTIGYLLDPAFRTDPFNRPFLVFLISACLYLLGSSMAHMFSSLSEVAYYVCFFIDYGTVSIYILGLSIAYHAYVFPPSLMNSTFHELYIPIAFLSSVVFSATSCESKLSSSILLRVHGRKVTFPPYYIWCNIPLLSRALFCSTSTFASSPSSHSSPLADHYHVIHVLFALGAMLTYGTHFPEVFAPGRFDFFGHSHQLFHLCNVGLTFYQYHALLTEMKDRREYLVAERGMPTFAGTFLLLLVDVCIHSLMVWTIARWLHKPKQLIRIKHKQGIPTIPIHED